MKLIAASLSIQADCGAGKNAAILRSATYGFVTTISGCAIDQLYVRFAQSQPSSSPMGIPGGASTGLAGTNFSGSFSNRSRRSIMAAR